MEIRKEINGFYELADMVWSGAVDTIAKIQNANKENELMNLLDDIFLDEIPTDTQVNDFLWFERDYIYECLELNEDGELIDEEEERKKALEESIECFKKSECFEDFCDDCDTCIFDVCKSLAECEEAFKKCKSGEDDIDGWMEL